MFDVAVIGGGPAGNRTAFRLAKSGLRTIVFEKRSAIGLKSCCTGIVSRECAALYDIPEKVVLTNIRSAALFSPSGELLHLHRPEDEACILNRPEFDRLMAERATAAGAEYRLATTVKQLSLQEKGAILKTEAKGKTVDFESRAVVIASGFNTSLTRQAGLTGTAYFAHGAQMETTAADVRETAIYFDQEIAPGFFSWIAPLRDGRCLVGLLTRSDPGHYLRRWLSSLVSRGLVKDDSAAIRYGSIPLKPLKKTFTDRLLIVGDAAGQVKPTTGGGIYFGMLCADMAADTLIKAFTIGKFSAATLAEYQKTWQSKMGNELKMGYYARKLFEHLSNRQIDSLITRLNNSGMVESVLQQPDLSFDWHGGLVLKAVKMGTLTGAKRLIQAPGKLFHR